MFGETPVHDQMCQNWFAKLHVGDFSLDHAAGLGRPVEVDSDQIKTLIENDQHSTTREIANILKIFQSIKVLVKMKMSVILQKKLSKLFGQTNTFMKVGCPLIPTRCDWFI